MVHVVFVHGTGVREPAFTNTYNAVCTGLASELANVKVHPCYWAGSHGSNIGNGRSIPLYAQTMAVAASSTGSTIFEWSLLLDDPLIEFRLLAPQESPGGGATPGRSPAVILRDQLGKLQQAAMAGAIGALDATDNPIFLESVATLLAMPELNKAVAVGVSLAPSGKDLLDDVRLLAARAIVAGWMRLLLDNGAVSPTGATRDLLVEDTFYALGGGRAQIMGIGSNLIGAVLAPIKIMLQTVVVDPSLRLASWGSRTYRHSVANAATPAAGDILVYQTRGKPIRDFILNTAMAVGEPVVLLAHSLGGIACIDLLIEEARPCIKGVITAGSQAPFFYEIDALSQLERKEAMPAYMPPWLNFYDANDLLSFLAAPLMKAGNHVTDVEVHSGQPFPASHGAYWSNPAVWKASADFIRKL
jgi:hypothetical protein